MTRKCALVLATTASVGLFAAAALADTVTQGSPAILSFPALTQTAQPPAAALINGTAANFNQTVMQSQVPVLVEFYATWCPHCQDMTPIMQSLAQQYAGKARIVRIDIDQNPQLANRFHVTGVPHFFIMKNGRIIDNVTGETTAARLSAGLTRSFM